MANRSDFNSSLPRSIKKMLALSEMRLGLSKNQAHKERQDWKKAHDHHKDVVKRRLSGKAAVEETEHTAEE